VDRAFLSSQVLNPKEEYLVLSNSLMRASCLSFLRSGAGTLWLRWLKTGFENMSGSTSHNEERSTSAQQLRNLLLVSRPF